MNTFFDKPSKQQFLFRLKIALAAILVNVLFAILLWPLGLLVLSLLIVSITLSIIASFFDVPSLVKSGKMQYYSNLLLGEAPKNGKITLHGGTLFDYYFVLQSQWSGTYRSRYIILQYINGLLALMEKHPDDTQIQGTSYIITPKTAQKIGLRQVPTNFIQRIILYYNFFNLMCGISMAKNRWSIPNLSKIYTYQGSIKSLKKHKAFLLKFKARLEQQLNI